MHHSIGDPSPDQLAKLGSTPELTGGHPGTPVQDLALVNDDRAPQSVALYVVL